VPESHPLLIIAAQMDGPSDIMPESHPLLIIAAQMFIPGKFCDFKWRTFPFSVSSYTVLICILCHL
jgi:hypothetical protein